MADKLADGRIWAAVSEEVRVFSEEVRRHVDAETNALKTRLQALERRMLGQSMNFPQSTKAEYSRPLGHDQKWNRLGDIRAGEQLAEAPGSPKITQPGGQESGSDNWSMQLDPPGSPPVTDRKDVRRPSTDGTFPLTHQSDFDTNGVLYFLGSREGKYRNPMKAGLVKVTSSSLFKHPSVSLEHFVQHSKEVKNGAGCQVHTKDEEGAWVALELQRGWALEVNYYCLRHRMNHGEVLRNWTLQGSPDGKDWFTLKSHKNDLKLEEKAWSTAGWNVDKPHRPCSYFRIQLTGEDSSGSYYITSGGIELYGNLQFDARKASKSKSSTGLGGKAWQAVETFVRKVSPY